MGHEVFLKTSHGRRRFLIDDAFWQSLSVSPRNRESCSLFLSSWLLLLADSPLSGDNKPPQLYNRFISMIRSKGLKEVVVSFTDLAHKLVSQHSIMGTSSSIGEWIADFKDTPVFFEYHHYYQTGDPIILDYLYTFLNFGKKLEYDDESFYDIAFRDWIGIEKRLSDHKYEDFDVRSLSCILSIVLPTFSWRDLRPKFGPGRVQERGVVGRIGKLRSFQYDPIIDRFLLHGHIGMYGYGADSGVHYEKIIPDPSSWTPARGVSSRTARLRFVPKNLKVARSICMEPNVLMFFQQAVSARFLELMQQSPLNHFIDIKDQSRNRSLSLSGSITGDIDTLDLSAASDSLSYRLVKMCFPSSWQIPMRATRSHSAILPNGEVHHLEKFAPMGSALCFPTQCIIFASVCIFAACLYTYEVEHVDIDFLDWLPSNVLRVISKFLRTPHYSLLVFQPLAIYGDDICLDGRLTPIVKSILSRLGFVVNETKSFVGSQSFRESCGGFYLNGNDITPLYFRIKGVRKTLTPNHVASQVHLINECRKKGYKNLYRFLHHSIMTWECRRRYRNNVSSKNSIPYVSDPQLFGILVPRPVNSHLQFRENSDYQRSEIRAWTISYDRIEQPKELLSFVDSYEYMRWWASRTSSNTTEDSSSVKRYDTSGAGLVWRWIPRE